jgi:Tetracyclin repressor-like, C-terminal domain
VLREDPHRKVLVAVMTASQHSAALRDAARDALGAPYGCPLERVLARAVDRGWTVATADVEIFAEVLPAIAYQRVAVRGLLLSEDDVVRVVDGDLLPVLAAPGEGRRA